MKIFILGNSGSGKSYLARNLAKKIKCEWLNLDHISFSGDHYTKFKSLKERLKLVRQFMKENSNCIIEGVYPDIFYEIEEKFDELIYLDFSHIECEKGLRQRKHDKSMTTLEEHNSSLEDFIHMTKLYYVDHSYSVSKFNHDKIFEGFLLKKSILKNRDEVNQYIKDFKV